MTNFQTCSRTEKTAFWRLNLQNYNNLLNSSSVKPALRIIALSVYGFIRACRGIVIFRVPFVIPICFAPRLLEIQKLAFLKTIIARLDETSVKSIERVLQLPRIRNLYLTDLSILKVTFCHIKIGYNSITNILNCLSSRRTLTVTARKSRDMNIIPIFTFMNDSRVFHKTTISIRQTFVHQFLNPKS